MPLGDVLVVLLRDDERPDARLLRAVRLFKDASDGTHAAGERDFARDRDVLPERLLRHGADERREDRRARARAVDVAAADDVDVHVVVVDALARQMAQHGGRVEYGVLRHAARRLVEAHLSLALFLGGEDDGLDLDDGAKESRDAEPEDVPDLGLLRSLLRHELVEAADLRDLVDVCLGDLDVFAFFCAREREAVGVGEDVDRLAAFRRILADEAHDFLCDLDLELLRRILHDLLDVLGRQRLEVDFRAARAKRGVDVRGVARRRADEHEVGRCALLEELPYIGRHLLVRMVVVGGLEEGALVFEHLQELVLQHFVHLADLVDEEDAAVRFGDHAGLWLGDAAVGEIAARALIDRVVHRA